MTLKINAKIVKTSSLEAIILTDDEIPLSDVIYIEQKGPDATTLLLIAEDKRFEVSGVLTGLESVFLWSSNQNGSVMMEEPKSLQWIDSSAH